MLLSGKEYLPQESNPMLQPVYLYLSRSVFLVCFIDPSTQLLNEKSVLKSLNCGPNK